jgi:hypothetical protein
VGTGAKVLLVWLVVAGACDRSRPFDSADWQAASSNRGDAPTVRQRMVGDVVQRLLPGKSRGEIERLLGPSLDTKYFKETGRDLIYVLGPERSFISIDDEWLLIWLDQAGRFRQAEMVTD